MKMENDEPPEPANGGGKWARRNKIKFNFTSMIPLLRLGFLFNF